MHIDIAQLSQFIHKKQMWTVFLFFQHPLDEILGNKTHHAKGQAQKDHEGAKLAGLRRPGPAAWLSQPPRRMPCAPRNNQRRGWPKLMSPAQPSCNGGGVGGVG
jgi:hypothetical protein